MGDANGKESGDVAKGGASSLDARGHLRTTQIKSTHTSRLLIASYKLYPACLKAFPKRRVIVDSAVPPDHFYWFTPHGVHWCNTRTMEIYACDHERGYPFAKVLRTLTKTTPKAKHP